MGIVPYKGITPTIDPSVFIAGGVHIIGDVHIGKDSSVWYNTVIRGDVHYIRIGERTNIQDNTVVHVTNKKFPTNIGSNVTIGHSAVIHACTINDYSLIGMGAVVLDDAKVGKYCLIAAGAVVTMGMVIPDGMLAAGVPAKIIRPLTMEERKFLEQSAQNYIDYVATYR
ncbi:MAG: gamma carbonic anhydrase family protein [Bacteroidota bacterium]|jgi:carbonic anhydrase/acetyltransferase-like protein (isoleucine patch superfamily)